MAGESYPYASGSPTGITDPLGLEGGDCYVSGCPKGGGRSSGAAGGGAAGAGSGLTAPKAPPIRSEYHGFASRKALNEHFTSPRPGHGQGFASADEYGRSARHFAQNAHLHTDTKAYVRHNGEIVYYRPTTNEFTIVTKQGVIKTYYRPTGGMNHYHNQIIDDIIEMAGKILGG